MRTIEQVLEEIGEIEIVKLSEKKIRLDYTINILCQEKIVKTLKLKIRYKIDNDIYRMYYPKAGFINKLSNSLRVKKCFIHYGTIHYAFWMKKNSLPHTNQSFEYKNFKFNNLITSIHVTDENWFKNWNRNSKLNKLLNE